MYRLMAIVGFACCGLTGCAVTQRDAADSWTADTIASTIVQGMQSYEKTQPSPDVGHAQPQK
jgi:hypothetical protein